MRSKRTSITTPDACACWTKSILKTDIVRQQQLRLASQIRLSLALAALDHALGTWFGGAPKRKALINS